LIAVAGAMSGLGPFQGGPLREELWILQSYMAVVAVTLLTLGAAMEERAAAFAGLQRALSLRDEFLSIASHELRTPLTTVVLQLTGLQRALRRPLQSPSTDQPLGSKLDRAVRQADRL